MQNTPKILIALIIAAIFTACATKDTKISNSNSSDQNTNSAAANSVKDDIEELEMVVKLPVTPEEVVWREDNLAKTGDPRVPAPTDKKLVAVLRFLKENSEKLVVQAGKYKPAAEDTINTENWFPAELIAQSQMSGDETLKGTKYAADDFYNMPYTDGKLTRIDGTDYFVLELFAK